MLIVLRVIDVIIRIIV